MPAISEVSQPNTRRDIAPLLWRALETAGERLGIHRRPRMSPARFPPKLRPHPKRVKARAAKSVRTKVLTGAAWASRMRAPLEKAASMRPLRGAHPAPGGQRHGPPAPHRARESVT